MHIHRQTDVGRCAHARDGGLGATTIDGVSPRSPLHSRLLPAALALVVLVGAACSDGDDDDPQAFCAEVAATIAQLPDDPFQALQSRDAERVRTELGAMRDAFDRLQGSAPETIEEDLRRLRVGIDEVLGVLEQHDYDVEAAADDLQELELGEPENLAALQTSNQAVRAYVDQQCPGALPTTTAAAPEPTPAPAD